MKPEKSISLIFSHPVLSSLFIYLTEAPLKDVFTGIVFISIIPVLPIILFKKDDVFVSKRKDRDKYYLWAILSYLIGQSMISDQVVKLLAICYTTVTTTMLCINRVLKPSIHTAAISGPVTFLAIEKSLMFSLFYLLILPVSWARYKMNAHTTKELILGAGIGICVTLLTVAMGKLYLY